MKYILSLILLSFSSSIFSCECPPWSSVNKLECSKYEVIFEGVVKSVSDNFIEVAVVNPYKNIFDSEVEISFSQIEGCEIVFNESETWLFYLKKNNAQDLIFNFCSRSRKLVEENDFIAELTGQTYFQEKAFLGELFPDFEVSKNELKPKSYEKVDPKLIPVLLGVSLLFMTIGYWIMKKVGKNKAD